MGYFSKEKYNANLALLHKNRHVFDQNIKVDINKIEKKYTFERSRENNLILSYKKNKGKIQHIHSVYSPTREAERFVDGNSERIHDILTHWSETNEEVNRNRSELLVYGFACAYHIREIIKKYPDVMIHVFDFNSELFHYTLGCLEIEDVLTNSNVRLVISNNKSKIATELGKYNNHSSFIVYKPCLQLIPNELETIKEFLMESDIQRQTVVMNKDLIENNFTTNTHIPFNDCSPFIQLFEGIPVILVSAGPSLAQNISQLEQARDFALIGAVGTALKPLLSIGFKPDFIMMTDPKHHILSQIDEDCELPLFYLSTVCSEVVKYYKGPKFIVFQEGYGKAELLADKIGVKRIKTGGSVATTLLDLVVQFGANPVCFVGQDLSYSNGQSHAKGTHLYRNVKDTLTSHYVKDYYQNQKIPTSGNLKSYLKWFNRYIEENSDIQFYNATEGGAYINGATHISLQEFIRKIKDKPINSARNLFYKTVNLHSK